MNIAEGNGKFTSADRGRFFDHARGSALESMGVVEAVRTGDLRLPISVSFATVDGTGEVGSDYLAQSGTLLFTAGETNKTLNIGLVDDPDVEGGETVELRLSLPSDEIVLGSRASSTLTIRDNEKPVPLLNSFAPDIPSPVTKGVLQNDGRIVLASTICPGGAECSREVFRLLSDGSRDPSFRPITEFRSTQNWTPEVAGIAVQPDGKLLLVGTFTNIGASGARGIARFNADGLSDDAFNTNVTISFNLNSGESGPRAVAVQPDGKIVLGGRFFRVIPHRSVTIREAVRPAGNPSAYPGASGCAP